MNIKAGQFFVEIGSKHNDVIEIVEDATKRQFQCKWVRIYNRKLDSEIVSSMTITYLRKYFRLLTPLELELM